MCHTEVDLEAHYSPIPDDLHFPTLTVNRTMKFALRNKIPKGRPEELADPNNFVLEKRNEILDSLGIGHTKKTKVGNEFIRGVSGGERKRMSLAEVLAGQVRGLTFSSIIGTETHTCETEPSSDVG